MISRNSVALTAVSLALAANAIADPITHHFRGPITLIDPQLTERDLASQFQMGEMVMVSLTYEGDTPEDKSSAGNPNDGNYTDPSLSFSFVFEETQQQFSMKGAPFQIVHVVNDLAAGGIAGDSVRVSTSTSLGGTVNGTVDGTTPVQVDLTLLDRESGGALPTMLIDDSLPQSSFQPDSAMLTFVLVDLADHVGIRLGPISVVPEPSTLLVMLVLTWGRFPTCRWGLAL